MTASTRLTPLAQILDMAVYDRGGLATYLAVNRMPGTQWKSFDEIAEELTHNPLVKRVINRVSVKTFADQFGIPDTRYAEGRKMPATVSDETVGAYLAALPGELQDSVVHVLEDPADTDDGPDGDELPDDLSYEEQYSERA